MAGMLTPEQMAQFTQELQAQDGGPEPDNLSPEQQQAPTDGAEPGQMTDVAQPDAAAAAQAPAAPDPNADALASVGFGSVPELVEAFKASSAGLSQVQAALDQLMTMKQAMGNEDELDPNDPNYAIRSVVRSEFAPLFDKVRADVQNQLVQRAWGDSARNMVDLDKIMPEIEAFLKENSDLSTAPDGLQRAYDRVRSSKYRSEDQLLSDPEFQKKAVSNEAIKKAIIEAHLADVAKNGDIPASIGDAGSSLLTGKKKGVNTMDDAKNGLLAMLSKN